MKESAAPITRDFVILGGENSASQAQWRAVLEAASRLAIEATAGNVHNAAEIEQVITSFAEKPNGGLVVLPHALTVFNAPAIIALAHRYRMPDAYALAEDVTA